MEENNEIEMPMRFDNWLYVEDVNGKQNVFNIDNIISIKEGKKEGVSYIYDIRSTQVPNAVKCDFESLLGLIYDVDEEE